MGNILFNTEKDFLHISIIVTGRCNASCDYCHFYAYRNREEVNIDISEELFNRYINIIKYLKNEKDIKNLSYRFSGGEPLILGNRMFDMTKYGYDKTNIKPYILSNGKLVNEKTIKQAKNNGIQAFVVSIENPFDVAKGAVPLSDSFDKIIKYNSTEFPVVPGAVIVSNNMFKNLEKICDYFYNKIGEIPTISEKTFAAYERPTKQELEELTENVKNVVRKYLGKTRLELFPYIIPEVNSEKREFLVELDLKGDCINLEKTIEENANELLKSIEKSYPNLECDNKNCECFEGCKYCKWVWLNNTGSVTAKEKREDYCLLKKALYKGINEGLEQI